MLTIGRAQRSKKFSSREKFRKKVETGAVGFACLIKGTFSGFGLRFIFTGDHTTNDPYDHDSTDDSGEATFVFSKAVKKPIQGGEETILAT